MKSEWAEDFVARIFVLYGASMKNMKNNFAIVILSILLCGVGSVQTVEAKMVSAQLRDTAAQFYLREGVSFYKRGSYQEARTAFQKVVLMQPHNAKAKKYLEEITRIQSAKLSI